MSEGGFDWTVVPTSVLQELASLSLNMIIDARGVDFQTEIANISSKSGQKTGLCRGVFKELLLVFQMAMKESKSTKQLKEHFVSQLEMSESVASSIVERWDDANDRISSSLLAKTLKTKRLVDLDWTFGVTASTSDMDAVGTAFLQLKMSLDVGEGNTQDEYMELSIDQFFSFLSSMEQCKKFLDMMSNSED